MTRNIYMALALSGLLQWIPPAHAANDSEETKALITQLDGGACLYKSASPDGRSPCEKRDIGILERVGLWSVRNLHEHCVMWAAACLGNARNVDAVPALIHALRVRSNVQTCDGVIPVRSTIATAIGLIGDKKAISALQMYIRTPIFETLSSGASGCAPKPESKVPASDALDRLQKGPS
jgi:hypothetical protein